MIRTVLITTAAFALISIGSGTAYTLAHAGHSVFVQGDDAEQLEVDLESIVMNSPHATIEQNLADLWSIYGSHPAGAALLIVSWS